MDRIFYLDWNTQKLFGWEDKKSDLVIDSIIRGIEAGDDFPAISVYQDKYDPNKFYISPVRELSAKSSDVECLSDGGHCRAVAHYIVGQPLKCELACGGPVLLEDMCVEISDVFIVNDEGDYMLRKCIFSNYR